MPKKINWLVENTAPGSLVLQAWLTRNQISPQLAQKYVGSGWLIKLRNGVYIRPGRLPRWVNAVDCLKDQLNFPVHLAGLSSLAYQGKAHYLQFEESAIWLQMAAKKTLPLWFKAFPEYMTQDSTLSVVKQRLTDSTPNQESYPEWLLLNNNLTSNEPDDLTTINIDGAPLTASTTELAAHELLSEVPLRLSFDHAAQVFQGLTTLSPRKVQSILERSNSIKTKRLYLFLSRYYAHPFVSRIDESRINIGSGKRQIIKDGGFDQQYQITVPRYFLGRDNMHAGKQLI